MKESSRTAIVQEYDMETGELRIDQVHKFDVSIGGEIPPGLLQIKVAGMVMDAFIVGLNSADSTADIASRIITAMAQKLAEIKKELV